MSKKVALVILDGWGLGEQQRADAIQAAHTPHYQQYLQQHPHATLKTFGLNVGLPEGQMGNSEVGHMNIGAGRVVYQELARIHKSIADAELPKNPELLNLLHYAIQQNKPLHLMGLVSDGGVHSHIDHLIELCRIADQAGVQQTFIHVFTDGRDTDPKSGKAYIEKLQQAIAGKKVQIATVIGRYYAMDRDNRWERVKLAYDLLVKGEGKEVMDIIQAMQESYTEGITDEFLKPIVQTGCPAKIQEGDAVLCFNFRTDRAREITQALTQQAFPEYGMHPLSLRYATMTTYDASFKKVAVLFHKDDLKLTLGEVLSQHHKTQLRVAETEKYPHVTFFFSGGREEPFHGEQRALVPSPKVATYDLQPEMSADGVKEAVCKAMTSDAPDFICVNFANPDMVGHTGVFSAVIQAVEKVDACLGELVETGKKQGYSFIIIADHGNADFMINEDGSPNTAHTTNLVPVILIDKDHSTVKEGILADIAPTVLKLLGVNAPAEMTGNALI